MSILKELYTNTIEVQLGDYIKKNKISNYKEIIINRGVVNENIDFIESAYFQAIIEISENTIDEIMLRIIQGMMGIQKKYGAKDKIEFENNNITNNTINQLIHDPFTGKQMMIKIEEKENIILTISN